MIGPYVGTKGEQQSQRVDRMKACDTNEDDTKSNWGFERSAGHDVIPDEMDDARSTSQPELEREVKHT